jgi:hypothetical protein
LPVVQRGSRAVEEVAVNMGLPANSKWMVDDDPL